MDQITKIDVSGEGAGSTFPFAFIKAKASIFGIAPEFLGAIVMTESAGNTYAMRFEPKWAYFVRVADFAKLVVSSEDTEKTAQATSWGLCQVMGSVARELGFNGWLSELTVPEIGLEIGARKIKDLADKYDTLEELASAYNAGHPTPDNQAYVDRVMGYFHHFDFNF